MTNSENCESCGKPATVTVCDWRFTGLANGYPIREPAGVHHFCTEHQRKAVCVNAEEEAAALARPPKEPAA